MDRVGQEIVMKNNSLGRLNEGSAQVYRFISQATPQAGVVAQEKYRQSISGQVPNDMAVDNRLRWAKKDWILTVGVTAASLLVFYILLKYKVITI